MRELRHGMRVRLRFRPADDWRAQGTIVHVRPTTAIALMDDFTVLGPYWQEGEVEAPLGDWVILRDQTPNPDHAAYH